MLGQTTAHALHGLAHGVDDRLSLYTDCREVDRRAVLRIRVARESGKLPFLFFCLVLCKVQYRRGWIVPDRSTDRPDKFDIVGPEDHVHEIGHELYLLFDILVSNDAILHRMVQKPSDR